jgi:type I restriction-modification system DNA methylase subunit
MNIAQIEINLQKLIKSFSKETFIYDLLLAYDLPKASITRLKKGNLNLSKVQGEISWKKKLFFKEEFKADLHLTISNLLDELKHKQQFIIVTDYKTLLSIDTETDDKLDIALTDLPKHYDFFLPWAGMKKAQRQNENPADIKAAEKMAKLFDEIRKDNPDNSSEFIHGLNVFLSRLLFCFFAEDTHIFEDNQFTNAIDSHTQADGSDLNTYLDKLFEVLNTPEKERKNLPEYLKAFPFANGGLFKEKHLAPIFTRGSRNAILNSGDQDWSAINPDIFGSMFQAVISVDQRGSLGQHYTSVPNILKVVEPLFLNDLYNEFEKAKETTKIEVKIKKLKALLNRLYNIKIFDPACGSGNFLIIAYKELRILEMKIFKDGGMLNLSNISLSRFYGIEVDDFAHEIAKLALWLAEHQMNVEFFKEFGRTNPTLPLKEAGQIVHSNATRLDWDKVCQKDNDSEVYILGNPPYLGSTMQNAQQKNDMAFVLGDLPKYKNLDYISCWFKKGVDYIKKNNCKCAFVTTNSITQGEQVALLWPYVFENNIEIFFSHMSFKWTNNAKKNAGVTVAIIGLRNISQSQKFIYSDNNIISTSNINAYLSPGRNVIVHKRALPLSILPKMISGNKPVDGGNLILSKLDKDKLESDAPDAKYFIKRFIGASEFMNRKSRYCLWIKDEDLVRAMKIDAIKERIEMNRKFRLNSKDKGAQALSAKPHQFRDFFYSRECSLLIPQTGSERRTYVPIGFLDSSIILSNGVRAIFDSEPWIFSLLSSKMHITWVKAVAGRLKMDMQYSNTLCYNTFPFPPISQQRKEEITQLVFRILEEREKHSDRTLAQLYDPDKMPSGLQEAHRLNDMAIERSYRSMPFRSDEERLEYLFKLYEKMISEEILNS